MESSEKISAYISSPICTNRLIFGRGALFILLFLIANQSHNFTNLNFCDFTLLFPLTSQSSRVPTMRKNTGERREQAPCGLRSLMRSPMMQDFSKHSLLDVLLPFIRKF